MTRLRRVEYSCPLTGEPQSTWDCTAMGRAVLARDWDLVREYALAAARTERATQLMYGRQGLPALRAHRVVDAGLREVTLGVPEYVEEEKTQPYRSVEDAGPWLGLRDTVEIRVRQ